MTGRPHKPDRMRIEYAQHKISTGLVNIMARASEPNGFLVKAIAVGATGIVVAVVAWSIIDGISADRDHSVRLTGLENRESIRDARDAEMLTILRDLRDARP